MQHIPQMSVFFGKTAQYHVMPQAIFPKIPLEKRIFFLFKAVVPKGHDLGQFCLRHHSVIHKLPK